MRNDDKDLEKAIGCTFLAIGSAYLAALLLVAWAIIRLVLHFT